jgi:hypothetical protein
MKLLVFIKRRRTLQAKNNIKPSALVLPAEAWALVLPAQAWALVLPAHFKGEA